jgi:hypothetical protein
MASLASFFRNTPIVTLRAYFDRAGIDVSSEVNWSGPEQETIRALVRAIDKIEEVPRARLANDAERIAAMADEPGQVALFSVAKNRQWLDGLRNPHDRALSMFLKEPVEFRHAEEVRFTDEHRRGRMWDGFIGSPDLVIPRDVQDIEAFKLGVRQRFQSANVHVDIFDRHRPTFEGEDSSLVQITVYREGLLDDFLEFENGDLVRRPRRPVFEAALTYESATGVIEVVANDRESREDLVRLLARDLLGAEFADERLPLRKYDLAILQRPYAFPTDPADGIESVRVTELRLMPLDSAGERVVLECLRQANRTIWAMARDRFGGSDPLGGGWVVTKAKLNIRFHPDTDSRRGRTLPLTITMPHGCNLKDQTEREQMIGEKYLRRWDIVRDV